MALSPAVTRTPYVLWDSYPRFNVSAIACCHGLITGSDTGDIISWLYEPTPTDLNPKHAKNGQNMNHDNLALNLTSNSYQNPIGSQTNNMRAFTGHNINNISPPMELPGLNIPSSTHPTSNTSQPSLNSVPNTFGQSSLNLPALDKDSLSPSVFTISQSGCSIVAITNIVTHQGTYIRYNKTDPTSVHLNIAFNSPCAHYIALHSDGTLRSHTPASSESYTITQLSVYDTPLELQGCCRSSSSSTTFFDSLPNVSSQNQTQNTQSHGISNSQPNFANPGPSSVDNPAKRIGAYTGLLPFYPTGYFWGFDSTTTSLTLQSTSILSSQARLPTQPNIDPNTTTQQPTASQIVANSTASGVPNDAFITSTHTNPTGHVTLCSSFTKTTAASAATQYAPKRSISTFSYNTQLLSSYHYTNPILIIFGSKSTVRLLDTSTGQILCVLPHNAQIIRCELSANDSYSTINACTFENFVAQGSLQPKGSLNLPDPNLTIPLDFANSSAAELVHIESHKSGKLSRWDEYKTFASPVQISPGFGQDDDGVYFQQNQQLFPAVRDVIQKKSAETAAFKAAQQSQLVAGLELDISDIKANGSRSDIESGDFFDNLDKKNQHSAHHAHKDGNGISHEIMNKIPYVVKNAKIPTGFQRKRYLHVLTVDGSVHIWDIDKILHDQARNNILRQSLQTQLSQAKNSPTAWQNDKAKVKLMLPLIHTPIIRFYLATPDIASISYLTRDLVSTSRRHHPSNIYDKYEKQYEKHQHDAKCALSRSTNTRSPLPNPTQTHPKYGLYNATVLTKGLSPMLKSIQSSHIADFVQMDFSRTPSLGATVLSTVDNNSLSPLISSRQHPNSLPSATHFLPPPSTTSQTPQQLSKLQRHGQKRGEQIDPRITATSLIAGSVTYGNSKLRLPPTSPISDQPISIILCDDIHTMAIIYPRIVLLIHQTTLKTLGSIFLPVIDNLPQGNDSPSMFTSGVWLHFGKILMLSTDSCILGYDVSFESEHDITLFIPKEQYSAMQLELVEEEQDEKAQIDLPSTLTMAETTLNHPVNSTNSNYNTKQTKTGKNDQGVKKVKKAKKLTEKYRKAALVDTFSNTVQFSPFFNADLQLDPNRIETSNFVISNVDSGDKCVITALNTPNNHEMSKKSSSRQNDQFVSNYDRNVFVDADYGQFVDRLNGVVNPNDQTDNNNNNNNSSGANHGFPFPPNSPQPIPVSPAKFERLQRENMHKNTQQQEQQQYQIDQNQNDPNKIKPNQNSHSNHTAASAQAPHLLNSTQHLVTNHIIVNLFTILPTYKNVYTFCASRDHAGLFVSYTTSDDGSASNKYSMGQSMSKTNTFGNTSAIGSLTSSTGGVNRSNQDIHVDSNNLYSQAVPKRTITHIEYYPIPVLPIAHIRAHTHYVSPLALVGLNTTHSDKSASVGVDSVDKPTKLNENGDKSLTITTPHNTHSHHNNHTKKQNLLQHVLPIFISCDMGVIDFDDLLYATPTIYADTLNSLDRAKGQIDHQSSQHSGINSSQSVSAQNFALSLYNAPIPPPQGVNSSPTPFQTHSNALSDETTTYCRHAIVTCVLTDVNTGSIIYARGYRSGHITFNNITTDSPPFIITHPLFPFYSLNTPTHPCNIPYPVNFTSVFVMGICGLCVLFSDSSVAVYTVNTALSPPKQSHYNDDYSSSSSILHSNRQYQNPINVASTQSPFALYNEISTNSPDFRSNTSGQQSNRPILLSTVHGSLQSGQNSIFHPTLPLTQILTALSIPSHLFTSVLESLQGGIGAAMGTAQHQQGGQTGQNFFTSSSQTHPSSHLPQSNLYLSETDLMTINMHHNAQNPRNQHQQQLSQAQIAAKCHHIDKKHQLTLYLNDNYKNLQLFLCKNPQFAPHEAQLLPLQQTFVSLHLYIRPPPSNQMFNSVHYLHSYSTRYSYDSRLSVCDLQSQMLLGGWSSEINQHRKYNMRKAILDGEGFNTAGFVDRLPVGVDLTSAVSNLTSPFPSLIYPSVPITSPTTTIAPGECVYLTTTQHELIVISLLDRSKVFTLAPHSAPVIKVIHNHYSVSSNTISTFTTHGHLHIWKLPDCSLREIIHRSIDNTWKSINPLYWLPLYIHIDIPIVQNVLFNITFNRYVQKPKSTNVTNLHDVMINVAVNRNINTYSDIKKQHDAYKLQQHTHMELTKGLFCSTLDSANPNDNNNFSTSLEQRQNNNNNNNNNDLKMSINLDQVPDINLIDGSDANTHASQSKSGLPGSIQSFESFLGSAPGTTILGENQQNQLHSTQTQHNLTQSQQNQQTAVILSTFDSTLSPLSLHHIQKSCPFCVAKSHNLLIDIGHKHSLLTQNGVFNELCDYSSFHSTSPPNLTAQPSYTQRALSLDRHSQQSIQNQTNAGSSSNPFQPLEYIQSFHPSVHETCYIFILQPNYSRLQSHLQDVYSDMDNVLLHLIHSLPLSALAPPSVSHQLPGLPRSPSNLSTNSSISAHQKNIKLASTINTSLGSTGFYPLPSPGLNPMNSTNAPSGALAGFTLDAIPPLAPISSIPPLTTTPNSSINSNTDVSTNTFSNLNNPPQTTTAMPRKQSEQFDRVSIPLSTSHLDQKLLSSGQQTELTQSSNNSSTFGISPFSSSAINNQSPLLTASGQPQSNAAITQRHKHHVLYQQHVVQKNRQELFNLFEIEKYRLKRLIRTQSSYIASILTSELFESNQILQQQENLMQQVVAENRSKQTNNPVLSSPRSRATPTSAALNGFEDLGLDAMLHDDLTNTISKLQQSQLYSSTSIPMLRKDGADELNQHFAYLSLIEQQTIQGMIDVDLFTLRSHKQIVLDHLLSHKCGIIPVINADLHTTTDTQLFNREIQSAWYQHQLELSHEHQLHQQHLAMSSQNFSGGAQQAQKDIYLPEQSTLDKNNAKLRHLSQFQISFKDPMSLCDNSGYSRVDIYNEDISQTQCDCADCSLSLKLSSRSVQHKQYLAKQYEELKSLNVLPGHTNNSTSSTAASQRKVFTTSAQVIAQSVGAIRLGDVSRGKYRISPISGCDMNQSIYLHALTHNCKQHVAHITVDRDVALCSSCEQDVGIALPSLLEHSNGATSRVDFEAEEDKLTKAYNAILAASGININTNSGPTASSLVHPNASGTLTSMSPQFALGTQQQSQLQPLSPQNFTSNPHHTALTSSSSPSLDPHSNQSSQMTSTQQTQVSGKSLYYLHVAHSKLLLKKMNQSLTNNDFFKYYRRHRGVSSSDLIFNNSNIIFSHSYTTAMLNKMSTDATAAMDPRGSASASASTMGAGGINNLNSSSSSSSTSEPRPFSNSSSSSSIPDSNLPTSLITRTLNSTSSHNEPQLFTEANPLLNTPILYQGESSVSMNDSIYPTLGLVVINNTVLAQDLVAVHQLCNLNVIYDVQEFLRYVSIYFSLIILHAAHYDGIPPNRLFSLIRNIFTKNHATTNLTTYHERLLLNANHGNVLSPTPLPTPLQTTSHSPKDSLSSVHHLPGLVEGDDGKSGGVSPQQGQGVAPCPNTSKSNTLSRGAADTIEIHLNQGEMGGVGVGQYHGGYLRDDDDDDDGRVKNINNNTTQNTRKSALNPTSFTFNPSHISSTFSTDAFSTVPTVDEDLMGIDLLQCPTLSKAIEWVFIATHFPLQYQPPFYLYHSERTEQQSAGSEGQTFPTPNLNNSISSGGSNSTSNQAAFNSAFNTHGFNTAGTQTNAFATPTKNQRSGTGTNTNNSAIFNPNNPTLDLLSSSQGSQHNLNSSTTADPYDLTLQHSASDHSQSSQQQYHSILSRSEQDVQCINPTIDPQFQKLQQQSGLLSATPSTRRSSRGSEHSAEMQWNVQNHPNHKIPSASFYQQALLPPLLPDLPFEIPSLIEVLPDRIKYLYKFCITEPLSTNMIGPCLQNVIGTASLLLGIHTTSTSLPFIPLRPHPLVSDTTTIDMLDIFYTNAVSAANAKLVQINENSPRNNENGQSISTSGNMTATASNTNLNTNTVVFTSPPTAPTSQTALSQVDIDSPQSASALTKEHHQLLPATPAVWENTITQLHYQNRYGAVQYNINHKISGFLMSYAAFTDDGDAIVVALPAKRNKTLQMCIKEENLLDPTANLVYSGSSAGDGKNTTTKNATGTSSTPQLTKAPLLSSSTNPLIPNTHKMVDLPALASSLSVDTYFSSYRYIHVHTLLLSLVHLLQTVRSPSIPAFVPPSILNITTYQQHQAQQRKIIELRSHFALQQQISRPSARSAATTGPSLQSAHLAARLGPIGIGLATTLNFFRGTILASEFNAFSEHDILGTDTQLLTTVPQTPGMEQGHNSANFTFANQPSLLRGFAPTTASSLTTATPALKTPVLTAGQSAGGDNTSTVLLRSRHNTNNLTATGPGNGNRNGNDTNFDAPVLSSNTKVYPPHIQTVVQLLLTTNNNTIYRRVAKFLLSTLFHNLSADQYVELRFNLLYEFSAYLSHSIHPSLFYHARLNVEQHSAAAMLLEEQIQQQRELFAKQNQSGLGQNQLSPSMNTLGGGAGACNADAQPTLSPQQLSTLSSVSQSSQSNLIPSQTVHKELYNPFSISLEPSKFTSLSHRNVLIVANINNSNNAHVSFATNSALTSDSLSAPTLPTPTPSATLQPISPTPATPALQSTSTLTVLQSLPFQFILPSADLYMDISLQSLVLTKGQLPLPVLYHHIDLDPILTQTLQQYLSTAVLFSQSGTKSSIPIATIFTGNGKLHPGIEISNDLVTTLYLLSSLEVTQYNATTAVLTSTTAQTQPSSSNTSFDDNFSTELTSQAIPPPSKTFQGKQRWLPTVKQNGINFAKFTQLTFSVIPSPFAVYPSPTTKISTYIMNLVTGRGNVARENRLQLITHYLLVQLQLCLSFWDLGTTSISDANTILKFLSSYYDSTRLVRVGEEDIAADFTETRNSAAGLSSPLGSPDDYSTSNSTAYLMQKLPPPTINITYLRNSGSAVDYSSQKSNTYTTTVPIVLSARTVSILTLICSQLAKGYVLWAPHIVNKYDLIIKLHCLSQLTVYPNLAQQATLTLLHIGRTSPRTFIDAVVRHLFSNPLPTSSNQSYSSASTANAFVQHAANDSSVGNPVQTLKQLNQDFFRFCCPEDDSILASQANNTATQMQYTIPQGITILNYAVKDHTTLPTDPYSQQNPKSSQTPVTPGHQQGGDQHIPLDGAQYIQFAHFWQFQSITPTILFSLITLIHKHPEIIFPFVPKLAQLIVRILDPHFPQQRKSLLKHTTLLIHTLVNTYPNISFDKQSQRLIVASHSYLIKPTLQPTTTTTTTTTTSVTASKPLQPPSTDNDTASLDVFANIGSLSKQQAAQLQQYKDSSNYDSGTTILYDLRSASKVRGLYDKTLTPITACSISTGSGSFCAIYNAFESPAPMFKVWSLPSTSVIGSLFHSNPKCINTFQLPKLSTSIPSQKQHGVEINTQQVDLVLNKVKIKWEVAQHGKKLVETCILIREDGSQVRCVCGD